MTKSITVDTFEQALEVANEYEGKGYEATIVENKWDFTIKITDGYK